MKADGDMRQEENNFIAQPRAAALTQSVQPSALILQPAAELSNETIQQLLAPVGFKDWLQAYACLRRIPAGAEARLALADLLPVLFMALSSAANPDRVLVSFERFSRNAPDPHQLLRYLRDNPRAVETLVTLFAGSQFLSEILLRHPEYLNQLTARKHVAELKPVEQLRTELQVKLAPLLANHRNGPIPPAELASIFDILRRFQRQELLRIGTYDLLDLFDLSTVTGQLSNLADSLVQSCLELAARQSQTEPGGFAVLGMGKLGGAELNYSSDIDLIFVAADRAGAYLGLAQQLIDGLARATGEGFLYRVDMRLRPWGNAGALVTSLEGHLDYLQKHARLWERQALLKARVIAGDQAIGHRLLRQAKPFLFNTPADIVRRDVRAMKERIETKLRRQGNSWGEVKLGAGSIRDIEFVTQYLQLVHGRQRPELHQRNTLDALAQLSAGGYIQPAEYRVLADGYIFLRTVEHHLQLMHYRQTHTLPAEAEALTHLARRLRFPGVEAGERFVARYQEHSVAIRTVYRRYLDIGEIGGQTVSNEAKPGQEPNLPAAHVARHTRRMPATYAATFTEAEIAHHTELIDRLGPDKLIEVEAGRRDDDMWQVTIVGFDYVGQLSLICGLLFVYGFDIVDGHVFSYGLAEKSVQPKAAWRRSKSRYQLPHKSGQEAQPKIVDVFTVRPLQPDISASSWLAYATDLAELTRLLHAGKQREAQGELAKRVVVALRELAADTTTLYPVEIKIDNDSSEKYTILYIEALDTIGFLYEFTNALALTGININHMTVDTVGNRVQDTLYVIDSLGRKITAANKLRELRAATVLIKEFTHLLPRSPNPEAALLNFRQFVGQLFTRPNWPDELTSLEQPEILVRLARLLGVSEFLWNDFLRMQYANLFPVLSDVTGLAAAKSKQQLQTELADKLADATDAAQQRQALNEFKDREMFRIDMRQIQGHITKFGQFSAELSDLVEVVVAAAYQLACAELKQEFGEPVQENRQPGRMTVCGLGKCGGRELGFASDIELMFIFTGGGRTSGPRVITNAEFYEKVVQAVNRIIQSKREGIFEIDLRLRPYGRAGSMAVSLDSFRRYFARSGDAWPYEQQALIKLRPIAGDVELGQEIVKLRDELIYTGEPFDVAAMRAMRERQVRHLVTAGTINAKFSPGGLVDIEYLVQGLQISYGHKNPHLRSTNTREAMAALAAAGIVTQTDFKQLYQAHKFLRQLINALRMVRGNAKDLTVPPPDSEEFDFLARRLNYGSNLAQLWADLTNHMTGVQELSRRLLG